MGGLSAQTRWPEALITAVDSSVVLDVLSGSGRFAEPSRLAMNAAESAGGMVACEAVWAEVRAYYEGDGTHAAAMAELAVAFSTLDKATAARAGSLWRQYRRRGGSRGRILADFLIGAHALLQADCLLTRDTGFYRTYFSSLRLLTPEID